MIPSLSIAERTERRDTDGDRSGVGVVIGWSVAIMVAGVGAYAAVRGRALSDPQRAFANGRWLLDIEHVVGLDVERGVQDWFSRRGATGLVNAIYAVGYWPVLAVALGWTAWCDRTLAARLGLALGLSGLVGLVVFGLFPVAPPRMLAGFVDTVGGHAGLASFAHPEAIANPYAAMPSFHVGWLVLAALAIRAAGGPRLVGAAALAPPAVMAVAVVATANHYLLDVVAGAALAVVAWRAAAPCLVYVRRGIEQQRAARPPQTASALSHRDRVLETVGGPS